MLPCSNYCTNQYCYSSYIIACVLCSRSVYRAPITLFSRTSGVWGCPWLKWPLDASLSHRPMRRNWNRFLASQWKGKELQVSPPRSHGPLGDQAAVSLSLVLWFCFFKLLLLWIYLYIINRFELNNYKWSVLHCLPHSIWPWQQTTDGHIWVAWLHSQWGERVYHYHILTWTYPMCTCTCGNAFSCNIIHSVLTGPFSFSASTKTTRNI